MIRITKWRAAGILLIVAIALFIDGYGYISRLVQNHSLSKPVATGAPELFGHQVYIHKGLDIQGGTELTIAICQGYGIPAGTTCRNGPDNGKSVADAQAATIPVLDQRVNGLGVAEATVQAEGNDKIIVELPGVSLQQAEQTIGTTAKLHFATSVPGPPNPNDPAFLRDQQNLWDPSQLNDPALYPAGSSGTPAYHWKIDDKIPASSVVSADVGTTQSGQPAVNITFNSDGGNEWNKITNDAFAQPQGTPANRIAIFLDNKIISAPQVTGGDQGNQTQITGLSLQQATSLAQQISAGALPAEIATVQATEVSATIGSQTVRMTLIAGGVGLLIVVLFMLFYYRFPGLLAVLALACYAAINLAVYKLVGVTVSLAGLAGFVLSVGMAVDANVLIFERTRDELRHGRGVGLAVEMGFRRAFPAIRDSNISTIIACIVLYAAGSSVVKGFAATLGVGVAISFFSAVLITQGLLTWALRWHIGRRPTLYTEIHQEYEEKPPKGRFDIVHSRNLFFLGSLVIIIPGILAIIIWGFRLGLDFSGGNRVDVQFQTPTTQSAVTQTVNSVSAALGAQVQSESSTQFTITTKPSDAGTLQHVINALDSSYHIARNNGQETIQVQQVGPTIASELVVRAVILVLVSSALIALYLALMFRRQRAISPWRFSVCTFLKLLHDVFVLAGIWAILGHFSDLGQVDSLFVTALLTSVAFSIHDTIVVFDRIRENLRVGPRLTFDQVVNLSTLQTMTRSLNTSLTVVFVLLALVLFGGASIQGFVLALLVGIVTGTYSSIFNASTLLVAWQKSRPPHTTPTRGPRRVTRAA